VRRTPFALALALLSPHLASAQGLSFYETRSVVLSPERVSALASESYWKARLSRQTKLTLIRSIEGLPAGLDALYASVSVWLPQAPAHASDWVFALNGNSGLGARAALRPAGQRPKLDLQPFKIDALSTVQAKSLRTNGWWPGEVFRHVGFPGEIDGYCASRAAVCTAMFSDSDQRRRTLLTVAAPSSQATFLVDRTGATAGQGGPLVRYLGEVGVTPLSPPADFAQRDITDLTFGGNGAIKGIGMLAQRERVAVKSAIAGYLRSGTRSAEADLVLPAGPAGEKMLYTLRFLPRGDEVTVESFGSAVNLLPAAGPRSDIRSIRSYPAGADRGKLLEWLRKRYPALVVKGNTPQEIATSADRTIERYSATAGWFAENYQITILDAKAANRRLAEVHGLSRHQRRGLDDFAASELRALEAVLQRLETPGLAVLRGTAFARQRAAEDASPFGDPRNRVLVTGQTFTQAAPRPQRRQRSSVTATIVIYDAAHSPTRFVGGRAPDGVVRVYPPVAHVMAHELAHVISQRAPVQRQFDALVKSVGASPFTRYAASEPATEFLPEAFALYLLDPAWVNDNHPELFARIQAYLRRPRTGAL
jgi:hypothetical protein